MPARIQLAPRSLCKGGLHAIKLCKESRNAIPVTRFVTDFTVRNQT
jgi:hypothetical protein